MKIQVLSPSLPRIVKVASVPIAWIAATGAASAKQVGEALDDMSEVQQSDPGGYTLMVISICLLFFLASALIGVTTWFMVKGKRKAK